MIRPEGFIGAAFGHGADGDGRTDEARRVEMSGELGIPASWATVRQVHGASVLTATRPGPLGEADAIVTTTPGLPVTVATADCLPVIIEGTGGVAIAHAGWRGAAAGVVGAARRALVEAGVTPERAAIGPGIGPCCFEVGGEVTDRFAGAMSSTSWGTPSVDLSAAVAADLDGLAVWRADECTFCGTGWHSYRRTATADRQVAVAWLPTA